MNVNYKSKSEELEIATACQINGETNPYKIDFLKKFYQHNSFGLRILNSNNELIILSLMPKINSYEKHIFNKKPISVYKHPLSLEGCYLTLFRGAFTDDVSLRCDASKVKDWETIDENSDCLVILIDSYEDKLCGIEYVKFDPDVIKHIKNSMINASRYSSHEHALATLKEIKKYNFEDLLKKSSYVGKQRTKISTICLYTEDIINNTEIKEDKGA